MNPPPSNVLPPLRDVIAQAGLAPKKSLGQHFLLDGNLLAKIVRGAGPIAGCEVIEIGPGPGGLTRAILSADAKHLTAIEKDARCVAALAALAEHYPGRFTIREADALGIRLGDIGEAPRKIIANLPYNVGTAMVVEWLQEAAANPGVIESFTVLLQKEVAQRMSAEPGSEHYGRLSVLMRQFTEAAILFDVPPGAFSPPPKVTSAVLHARLLDTPREEVELKKLERVVAAAFNHRRKMLRQSLKAVAGDAAALCAKAGVAETLRAEQCDLAMFARLARAL